MLVELVDAGLGREVDFHCVDIHTIDPQLVRHRGDGRILRGNDQVEAVLRELSCQLESDATRGPGFEGEGMVGILVMGHLSVSGLGSASADGVKRRTWSPTRWLRGHGHLRTKTLQPTSSQLRTPAIKGRI
jgi:hypothetical protein